MNCNRRVGKIAQSGERVAHRNPDADQFPPLQVYSMIEQPLPIPPLPA